MEWNFVSARSWDQSRAFRKYTRLTMPPGALEQVFQPALRILAQRDENAAESRYQIDFAALVFAGDHGVAKAHAVSAFPQEVTGQMLLNFVMGGAAMSVLSRNLGASLYVVDVGVASSYAMPPKENRDSNVTFVSNNLTAIFPNDHYPHGAHDIASSCAMSEEVFDAAWNVGCNVMRRAIDEHHPACVIFGEMGIGNTTPAAAIIAHCLDRDAKALTGCGTGIGSAQRDLKTEVIATAIKRHRSQFSGSSANAPENVLRSLGGFELVAIAAAAATAAENGVFVLVDGVIATASILPIALVSPTFRTWLIAGHRGAEPAHREALKAMELEPILDLSLRLGEGSGAAFAAGIIRQAVTLLNEMATFEAAGVSG